MVHTHTHFEQWTNTQPLVCCCETALKWQLIYEFWDRAQRDAEKMWPSWLGAAPRWVLSILFSYFVTPSWQTYIITLMYSRLHQQHKEMSYFLFFSRYVEIRQLSTFRALMDIRLHLRQKYRKVWRVHRLSSTCISTLTVIAARAAQRA